MRELVAAAAMGIARFEESARIAPLKKEADEESVRIKIDRTKGEPTTEVAEQC